MGSLIFKGAARGLYSEDHVSRDFPLILYIPYSGGFKGGLGGTGPPSKPDNYIHLSLC